ncbi:TIGR03617 family F420-dependent LLM class oxidoreductase [Mycobacterium koreense]|uniref:LLM class F420-dependent oxidoreductase n=1 Tax=Mycolicibacillus koreensis TaxID=1069220 RepID=A0A7I7S7C5_9MYCO|nr:TIGR03617 family F420-dependent LLM class oxidoreductase [Mycolicibacillus koreensis]MCV7250034.1 TIGR03617 family F420-dependent LLM class oxidoreductase [Mycolicibacillus koreensis]ODR04942.1 LLM class F420-dependent oxidoreductase [Mycolicibacillus koreensis]OSC31775.1 LLM class F420-dependent oxidoreductase [Mycolicibacillus koreensis]BBY52767.1 LLM class F420-dependent oxidoreductase [Mycolicibacillus koreensis]
MRLETLLPLGKVDPGLRTPATPLDIFSVAESASLLEDLGYNGLVVEETKDDPFTVLTLAAGRTQRLHLTTGVTIAFPRSPTVMALNAWTLQKLSQGRFTLGLGTQVRGHIQRRYGMLWHPPGPWMREYVQAVRAIWDCWQHGTPLQFSGEHYKLSLMVPLFDAGPIDNPDIPVHLASVNKGMCAVAGEVADGIRPHPVCTPSYIEDVMLPAVRRGAQRAGRSLDSFRVCMKPLVASARTEEELVDKVRDARARIAFYASTPGYAAAFEHLNLSDLATEAHALSKAQRWEELPALIDDETLDAFVVIGTYDEIGDRIINRFSGVVTDIEFSIAVHDDADLATLADLARTVKSADDSAARALITGRDTLAVSATEPVP